MARLANIPEGRVESLCYGGLEPLDHRLRNAARLIEVAQEERLSGTLRPSRFHKGQRDSSLGIICTQGYALWTNGRAVIAFQFFPGGGYKVLLHIPVGSLQLPLEEQENPLGLLRLLFDRSRFAEMPGILDRISIPEPEWAARARPLDTEEAQRAFIAETSSLLTQLSLAARAQIDLSERDIALARDDLSQTQSKIQTELELLLQDVPTDEQESFRDSFTAIFASPAHVDEASTDLLKPGNLGAIASRSWDTITGRLLETVLDYRERESARQQSTAIHGSFQIWKERFRIIEGSEKSLSAQQREARRRDAYADQVAYTFFIRLLLARTLEDKGIVRRLVSDGGLELWRQVSDNTGFSRRGEVSLHGHALLDVLFQSVSHFYQHFFNQPVFDWYTPDDYLLAVTLERLSTFSFTDINRDILGFAYEAYVERAFRNQKGHFLTRPEIVDYILDEANYHGREIIGRRVLDLAAGSGSFLVQAARRLRSAIADSQEELPISARAKREYVALTFIERIQTDFVGFEINPFSCYLAELNLFLQVLDDLVFLWRECDEQISVEEFGIYNTDSLVLSRYDMENGQAEWEDDGLHRDQARDIKLNGEGGFHYVMMNPPYVNRAKEQDSMDLAAVPFYRTIFGGGDTNYYLAFLKLANFYVARRGTVGVIVPLSLCGDQSAGGIRRWLAAPDAGPPPTDLAEEWTLQSITRFFSRTELFDDVTQGVCVCTWRRERAAASRLTIAGGWSISDARNRRVSFDRRRVVASDPRSVGLPVQDLWFDAWPVVPDESYLNLWERIRGRSSTDLWSWCDNRLVFQQGDFNMTRTRPLRSVSDGGRISQFNDPIETAGSKDIADFGHFVASGALDAGANVARMGLSRKVESDCEREREQRLQRILRLTQPESVAVIRAIVGLESARPVRGALFTRGPGHAMFAFEHSLQIVYPKVGRDSAMVEAVFALLVSSVSNFVISLFSTNANISTNELKRLPIPQLSASETNELAAYGRSVQERGTELSRLKGLYNTRNSDALAPDPSAVLSQMSIEIEQLPIAVMRGHIRVTGNPQRRVSSLVDREELVAVADDTRFAEAIGVLLGHCRDAYGECAVSVPVPGDARIFLDEMDLVGQKLRGANDRFFEAMGELDSRVLRMYGIAERAEQNLAGLGMPWASSQQAWAASIAERL